MTYSEAWNYLRSIGFILWKEGPVVKIDTHRSILTRGHDELVHYAEGIKAAREAGNR